MVLLVSGSQLFQACHRVVLLVLFSFSLYTSEMFKLVENRLMNPEDDSTQLAVVRKQADRPVVAASLNRDLARIQ